MSLENVKAFYERLALDEAFRIQVRGFESQEVGKELLQNSGYDFSQEEFEEYTEQLLETNALEDEMKDLSEKELEAVFGGASAVFLPGVIPVLLYGVVISQIRWLY